MTTLCASMKALTLVLSPLETPTKTPKLNVPNAPKKSAPNKSPKIKSQETARRLTF